MDQAQASRLPKIAINAECEVSESESPHNRLVMAAWMFSAACLSPTTPTLTSIFTVPC
jgi:hypothetical protein